MKSSIHTKKPPEAIDIGDIIQHKDHRFASSVLEIVHAIFIWEISIKWSYGFGLFWLSGWNVLDFLVTLTVIHGPMLFPDGGVSLLKVTRVLRVFCSAVGILTIHHVAMAVKVIAPTHRAVEATSNYLFLAVDVIVKRCP